ncbi:hypothetical protein GEMRC1_001614 [Eukaryota sp. GEM-RC1]
MNALPVLPDTLPHRPQTTSPINVGSVTLNQGSQILRHGFQSHSIMEPSMSVHYIRVYLHYLLGIDILGKDTRSIKHIATYFCLPLFFYGLHRIPQQFVPLFSSVIISTFSVTFFSTLLFLVRSYSSMFNPYFPSSFGDISFRFFGFSFICLLVPQLLTFTRSVTFFVMSMLVFTNCLYTLLIYPPPSVANALELPQNFKFLTTFSKQLYYTAISMAAYIKFSSAFIIFVCFFVLDLLMMIPSFPSLMFFIFKFVNNLIGLPNIKGWFTVISLLFFSIPFTLSLVFNSTSHFMFLFSLLNFLFSLGQVKSRVKSLCIHFLLLVLSTGSYFFSDWYGLTLESQKYLTNLIFPILLIPLIVFLTSLFVKLSPVFTKFSIIIVLSLLTPSFLRGHFLLPLLLLRLFNLSLTSPFQSSLILAIILPLSIVLDQDFYLIVFLSSVVIHELYFILPFLRLFVGLFWSIRSKVIAIIISLILLPLSFVSCLLASLTLTGVVPLFGLPILIPAPFINHKPSIKNDCNNLEGVVYAESLPFITTELSNIITKSRYSSSVPFSHYLLQDPESGLLLFYSYGNSSLLSHSLSSVAGLELQQVTSCHAVEAASLNDSVKKERSIGNQLNSFQFLNQFESKFLSFQKMSLTGILDRLSFIQGYKKCFHVFLDYFGLSDRFLSESLDQISSVSEVIDCLRDATSDVAVCHSFVFFIV